MNNRDANTPVFSLGLSNELVSILIDHEVYTLHDVQIRLDAHTLRAIPGIGPRRATRVADAVDIHRTRVNLTPGLLAFFTRNPMMLSIALLVIVTALVVGLTCARGPFRGFNGDEWFTLAVVTALLLTFESGRWTARSPVVISDTRLTTGRIRVLVVFVGATMALMSSAGSLDPYVPLNGIVSEEVFRILCLGLAFGLWEGVKEYRYAKRLQARHVMQSQDEKPDVWDRLLGLPALVQAAIVSGIFLVASTAVGEFGEVLHTLLGKGS